MKKETWVEPKLSDLSVKMTENGKRGNKIDCTCRRCRRS